MSCSFDSLKRVKKGKKERKEVEKKSLKLPWMFYESKFITW